MPEEKKENKVPSPLLLAVLAVAVIFVVADFLMKKQTPPPEPVLRTPGTGVARVAPVLPKVALKVKEEKETVEPVVAGATALRDPFLPPAVVRRARTEPTPPGPPAMAPGGGVGGVSPRPQAGRLQPAVEPAEAEKPAQTEKPAEEPVWTGTMAAAGEQIVIIHHKNKSYILQLGDKLPDTDYRVDEIREEMVILRAPGKELRLWRKET